MLKKEDIISYKNGIQSFLLNQQNLYTRIGENTKLTNLNLVESHINEIFELLNELEHEVNSHEVDYSVINNTASTLFEERDNRIGFKPDDMKLKETYIRNVSRKRDKILEKIRVIVLSVEKVLEDEGYKDTFILTSNNHINIMDLLDKLVTYAEMLTPREINMGDINFTSSDDTKSKLAVVKEYEESDLELESLMEVSFISKLTGKQVMAITGKDDLIKISSLERKISACEYALANLDEKTFFKTRELLMNFITRYKNELRFARMKFNLSDFDYIKSSLKLDKEEKEKEKRIFSYAGTFAMYLNAIDNNDEESMSECERYLETYEINDSELLEARVLGTNMYYQTKKEEASREK